MHDSKYLLMLGISTAAGSLTGILSNKRNPGLGALFGAAAGAAAGTIAAALYDHVMDLTDDGVDFYSETSPLYQGFDDVEVE